MPTDILVFVIGAMAGSVVNALAYRLPRNISWTTGRSMCPICKHALAWQDLIPLLSYVLLGGKCRYCKKAFGVRYFLVELIMAVGFVLIFNQFSIFKTLILMGILTVTMVIAVMDWETQFIAEVMVAAWGVLVVLFNWSNFSNWSYWTNILLAVVVGVGLIGGIWLLSRKTAMGEGDIEVAVVMGLWLGWPKMLVALWLAFVVGGLAGAGVVLTRRAGLKSKIAFGPFLVIGSWAAFLFGNILFKWTGL